MHAWWRRYPLHPTLHKQPAAHGNRHSRCHPPREPERTSVTSATACSRSLAQIRQRLSPPVCSKPGCRQQQRARHRGQYQRHGKETAHLRGRVGVGQPQPPNPNPARCNMALQPYLRLCIRVACRSCAATTRQRVSDSSDDEMDSCSSVGATAVSTSTKTGNSAADTSDTVSVVARRPLYATADSWRCVGVSGSSNTPGATTFIPPAQWPHITTRAAANVHASSSCNGWCDVHSNRTVANVFCRHSAR